MGYDQNCMQVIVTGKKLSGGVKLSEPKAMLSSGKLLKKSLKDELFPDHSIKFMDCSSGGLELEMEPWDI